MIRVTAWIAPLLFCASAFALGPHEILLLVNGNSPDSVAIAARFARLRAVPESNVLTLRLPDSATRGEGSISPEEFTSLIWEPAWTAARTRGLGHVLAWVYSAGFPVSVSTAERMSLQGVTFVRNRIPPAEDVKRGRYESVLFAGPSGPRAGHHMSQSFDTFREWLGDDMPLPSMCLGHTGERGNSREEVMKCLESGVKSDGTWPAGTVYFVTNADVRSTCRQWQFPAAVRELRELGCSARIMPDLPTGRTDVAGLMIGKPWVDPRQGMGYLPGAMAEHLTSMAAIFHSADQTKLSAWLAAGATASAGTVTEPLALWQKFPCARFYAHCASGCTLMESFYQAIGSPLQIMLVGDPLACPGAPGARIELLRPDAGGDPGAVTLRASVWGEPGSHYGRFVFLLDGRVAGEGRTLRLDTAGLSDGPHTVRCVAYRTGLVRSQAFAEKTIAVANGKLAP